MFRDFDYIKTRDGIIFIVVNGEYYPTGRIGAAPVYFPKEDGDRIEKSTGKRYIKRIEDDFSRRNTLIAKLHPEYLPTDKDLGCSFFMVKTADIVQHYKPREKTNDLLQGLLKGTKWERLISAITEIARIPIQEIGIYGSLLVGFNQSDSDVDIVIYGEENLKKLRNKFNGVLKASGVRIASWEQKLLRIKNWQNRERYTPISFDTLSSIETRRWSRINVYGDDTTCIRFAYQDDQIKTNLITTPPIKEVMIRGMVLDSFGTHFSPKIAKVRIENKIIEVISYFFLFFSCVFDNDEVEIFGNYRKDGEREYITLDRLEHYMRPII